MTETDWLTCSDPHEMLNYLEETEAGWLQRFLNWLPFRGHRPRNRKLQLFACACCRHLWHLLPDARSRDAIEVFERCADGQASWRERRQAIAAAAAAALEANGPRLTTAPRLAAAQARAADAVAGVFDAREGAHLAANWARESVRVWAHGAPTDLTSRGHSPLPSKPYVHKSWQRKRKAKKLTKKKNAVAPGGEAVWQAERRFQCDIVRDIFGNPFRLPIADSAWMKPQAIELAKTIYHDRAFKRLSQLADLLEEAGCTNSEILRHCREPGPHVRGCWVVDVLLGKSLRR
jgi:hypothetical protein